MMTEVSDAPIRLADWIRAATRRLAAAGFEVPRLEATRLADVVLDTTPADRILRATEVLVDDQRDRLERLLAERLAGRPLQYLAGRAAFRNLELEIGPGVFIPRPETEGLVQRALDWLKRNRPAPARPRVAEYGLGSGAIMVALLSERLDAEGWGVELSPEALEYARRNAAASGVGARTHLFLGDLDLPLAAAGAPRMDLIVSNPPYIPTELIPTIPGSVRDFEPLLALDGGPGGTVVIARIISAAIERLAPGGILLLEIDDSHGPAVLELMRDAGFVDPEIMPDDTGRPRYVRAGAPE